MRLLHVLVDQVQPIYSHTSSLTKEEPGSLRALILIVLFIERRENMKSVFHSLTLLIRIYSQAPLYINSI